MKEMIFEIVQNKKKVEKKKKFHSDAQHLFKIMPEHYSFI